MAQRKPLVMINGKLKERPSSDTILTSSDTLPWNQVTDKPSVSVANIKHSPYNAVGDGIADDTAAIQSALNSSHKVIEIPAGVYLISGTLTVPSGKTIQGSGRTSIIKMKAAIANNTNVFASSETTSIEIRDLYLDGNRANQSSSNHTTLIQFSNVTKLTLHNVHADGSLIDGIYLYLCKQVIVTNCSGFNNGYPETDASGMNLDTCEDVVVNGWQGYNNGFHGLYMSNSTRCSLNNVNVHHNSFDGVRMVWGCSFVNFSNLNSWSNGWRGIMINGESFAITLNGVNLNHNGTHGFACDQLYSCTITGGTISNNTIFGIVTSDGSDTIYIGNLNITGNGAGRFELNREENIIRLIDNNDLTIAISDCVNYSDIGMANGLATLDEAAKIPANQINSATATAIRQGSTSDTSILTVGNFNLSQTTTTLTDAANISINLQAGINFQVTLGGNRTLSNPSSIVAGRSGYIVVNQDSTGGRTLNFGSSWRFSGPPISTVANSSTLLAYYCHSSTVIYVASMSTPEQAPSGGGSMTGSEIMTALPAFTGDVTKPLGSSQLTLATVNSNIGTFGNATTIPVITVNAKGLITSVSTASMASYAPLASPALTGSPTAPTATVGTNTTQLATTAFVQQEVTRGLSIFRSGKPTNNETIGGGLAPYSFTLSSSQSEAKSSIAAAASTVFVIKNNGVQIGTVTWAASSTLGSISFTNTSLTKGDVLTIHAPSSADASISDIAIVLRA